MTALDFMMACIGTGVLLVCGAWSFKILGDARRGRSVREPVQRKDEPLDPMGQRLQEFRDAQFGMPMTPKPRGSAPPSWPVVRPRPGEIRKSDKDVGKKQGGK